MRLRIRRLEWPRKELTIHHPLVFVGAAAVGIGTVTLLIYAYCCHARAREGSIGWDGRAELGSLRTAELSAGIGGDGAGDVGGGALASAAEERRRQKVEGRGAGLSRYFSPLSSRQGLGSISSWVGSVSPAAQYFEATLWSIGHHYHFPKGMLTKVSRTPGLGTSRRTVSSQYGQPTRCWSRRSKEGSHGSKEQRQLPTQRKRRVHGNPCGMSVYPER